jgi:ornithine cyclodeaminase/alanine dehydrogenase-like protein (mu-crystallin family)
LKFLFDSDVRTGLDAADAVRAARRALVDAYKGLLAAPPRLHADLGERGLVFTAGGYVDGPVGFRVYGLWPGDSDQAVLVWDGSGRLAGCVVGTEIGARRTGALGGAAADALARANAASLGIVGSGVQAWTQLISAVRRLARVRVFSPTDENRERSHGEPKRSWVSARRRATQPRKQSQTAISSSWRRAPNGRSSRPAGFGRARTSTRSGRNSLRRTRHRRSSRSRLPPSSPTRRSRPRATGSRSSRPEP